MKTVILFVLLLSIASVSHTQGYVHDWSFATGASAGDQLWDMALDDNGNAYFVGGFELSVDFNSGSSGGTAIINSAGAYDVFIWKINSDGSLGWIKKIGGGMVDMAYTVEIDNDQNVVVGGMVDAGAIDLNPGSGTDIRNPISRTYFIVKLDNDGNYVWGDLYGSTDYGESDLTFDAENNIYVTGMAKYVSDWNPGSGTSWVNGDLNGFGDVFVMKVSSAGNFVWVKEIGAESYAVSFSITSDSTEAVYLTGYFIDTVDFDPGVAQHNLVAKGGSDIFILKLDTAGNFVWAQNLGGGSGNMDMGSEILFDGTSDLIVTGLYCITADFDFGSDTTLLNSTGNGDVFVLRIDTAGNFIWAKGFGGSQQDKGLGLAIDSQGNIFVSGHYSGTVDFDPGAAVYSLTATPGLDGFVSELNENGDFIWANTIPIDPSFASPYQTVKNVMVDQNDDLLISGTYTGEIDLDPTILNVTFTGEGNDDMFVCKWKFSSASMAENQMNRFKIYPNPANGNAILIGDEIEYIELYSVSGDLVQIIICSNESQVNLNLSEIESGIYLAKIVRSNSEIHLVKLIKN